MKEYIEWLERMIEQTREDKDLQREHWAFCQSLKKVRELAFHQCDVSGQSEQLDTVEKRNIFNDGYSLGLKTGKRQLENGV